jgi:hypothetical protein
VASSGPDVVEVSVACFRWSLPDTQIGEHEHGAKSGYGNHWVGEGGLGFVCAIEASWLWRTSRTGGLSCFGLSAA